MGLGCGTGGGGSNRSEAQGQAGEILISVASSMKDAVDELAQRFQSATGVTVRVNAGPSSGLAAQILSGAPAQLYLSASEEWADALEKEQLVLERVPLASNQLVIIVPRGNPAGVVRLEDLLQPPVRRVALAGERVPAGVYADQALRSAGMWEPLVEAGKVVRGQDVRITLSFVERAEADAGIVYVTDARLSDSVEVACAIDPARHEPIVYPLVLLKASEQVPAAKRFYDYLQTSESREVFARFGFELRTGE
jgi:molybdate transport system substrate-binding protein